MTPCGRGPVLQGTPYRMCVSHAGGVSHAELPHARWCPRVTMQDVPMQVSVTPCMTVSHAGQGDHEGCPHDSMRSGDKGFPCRMYMHGAMLRTPSRAPGRHLPCELHHHLPEPIFFYHDESSIEGGRRVQLPIMLHVLHTRILSAGNHFHRECLLSNAADHKMYR